MTNEGKKPCCKDWQPNCDKINGAITMNTTHGNPYTGKPFKFCPWCGRRVSDETQGG